MVRPSKEREVVPLTIAQSDLAGDGTEDGEDVDIDGGGTVSGGDGGVTSPPATELLEIVEDTDDGGVIIDLSDANWWDITLTADTTLTITNPPPSGVVGQLHIILRQGTGAPWLVTWPLEVSWPDTDGLPGGSSPILYTDEGAANEYTITTEDGGTTWDGPSDGAASGLVTVTDGVVTVSPATTMSVPLGGVEDFGGGNADLLFLTSRYGAQPDLVTDATVTTTYAIDCSQANWFDLTLTGNTTFTITNPPPATGEIFVILRQGGAGSKTVTWPGSVDWQDTDGTGGGSAATLHTAVGAVNIIGLATVDGGTTWGAWDEGATGSSISYATPAIVLSTAAAAGAASTVIRSDSTIVAFDATVPVTQAFADTAATGSAAVAARRDHKHGMPADPGSSGIGPILISDTPSTPLIFGDLIQNEAQDDLVYADP